MNEEKSLPQGWAWAKLGEILPISYGKALGESNRNPTGEILVYGSSGKVGKHDSALVHNAGLIIGRKGNVGSVYFSSQPFWAIDTVYFTEGNDGLDLKFFFYLLCSLNLKGLDRSTAVPGLSRNDYSDITVSIPPTEEQKRIAAKLDTLFSELDAGLAAIERARGKVKSFRASLLRAATSGELSASWRAENATTETGAQLLERILDERRTQWEEKERAKRAAKSPAKKLFEDESWKDKYVAPKAPETSELPNLPMSWCWASVQQICDVGTGATPARTNSDFFGGTIPWVTSGAVNDDTISHATQFITELAIQKTNVKIFPVGTLLMAMYGEGKTRGKVSELRIEAATNQACAAMVFRPETVSCRGFTKVFLASNYEKMRQLSAGGVQPNLNLTIVQSTALPLPPLTEQEWIVSEVERRLSLVSDTEKTLDAAQKRLQSLKTVILARAFRGELTEQDPTEESAEKLLERIRLARQEKAVAPKSIRPRVAKAKAPKKSVAQPVTNQQGTLF